MRTTFVDHNIPYLAGEQQELGEHMRTWGTAYAIIENFVGT
jgi:hypothetical protein